MTMYLYSVKDHKFIFAEPFISPDDSTAKRFFSMRVNNPQSGFNVMNYAPADFDLFRVGKFDTESGKIDECWPIEFICNGASVVGEE